METTTFHGDPQVKDMLLARIGAHEQADAIRQGAYEVWHGTVVRRCAVGCSLRDLSDRGDEPTPTNWHAEMERALGIPEWLAVLEDRVFEGMTIEQSGGWPRRFSEAVPVGVSLDGLADVLAIRRLREECLPLSDTWPESVRAEVVAAIEQTIAALRGKGDRASAAMAAAAARSAAVAASASARSAAAAAAAASAALAASAAAASWSAWSAESAGLAAESAARSARSAWSAHIHAPQRAESAESAAASARWSAYGREADRIVAALSEVTR